MRYYLIAGEASGDLHGSNLIKGLKAEDPIKWVGLMNLARTEAEHNVMTEIICA